jgi:hypothetical protein
MTYRGIVRGKIIELEAAPPLEDGQVVSVRVLPAVRGRPKPPATTTGPGAGENRCYWENLVRTAKNDLTKMGVLERGLGHGLYRLLGIEGHRQAQRQ